MNRRSFLLGAGASVVTCKSAFSAIDVSYPKRAYVTHPAIIKQQCMMWCWAASSAMIFSSLGHPIDQTAIVNRVFGGMVCQGAMGITMAKVLSDRWMDMNGTSFQSHLTAAFDVQAGVNAITYPTIINELANDRPLLYANGSHAMVIVEAIFVDTPYGPSVQSIGVLDPAPSAMNFHYLSQLEMMPAPMAGMYVAPGQPVGQMQFLAAVQII